MSESYLTPYVGMVEGSYATDAALQAITSAVPGATYWSDESGTYFYNPSITEAASTDLSPTSSLVGVFQKSDIQLVKVNTDGKINGFNVSITEVPLTAETAWFGNSNNEATETPVYSYDHQGGIYNWIGGLDTETFTLVGVDPAVHKIIGCIQTPPTEAAYLKAIYISAVDQITVELSAANTSNDCVIAFAVKAFTANV